MVKEKILHYTAFFEPAEEGGFTVTVPALPGCISEGDTFEKAKHNIKEAIELYLEVLLDQDKSLPIENEHPMASSIDVKVPA